MHEVERSPEIKVVSSQCCYSMLLYVTDCDLSLAKARGSRGVFYKTLEVAKTDPNPSGFRIPGKDLIPDNFPSQLRVPFSFLCDRCTQRPLDVGG